MQRRPWARVTTTTAAIVLAIAVFGVALPYAAHGIDAATPSPTPQAHAEATATPTPRPTRTPAPAATPVPILTPLPSLDDLRYYTPVAEAPAEAPTPVEEPPAATAVPPRAPAAQNQPPRAPVRATQPERAAIATPEPPDEPAVLEPVAEPTRKPSAPLPAATARSTRLPPAPVSNAQPPIDLTPAGVAGGGPAKTRAPIASNTLIVVGIGLLAAGGSWGFYYLLREND